MKILVALLMFTTFSIFSIHLSAQPVRADTSVHKAALDAVNSFKSTNEIWMFVPSFYLKQKNNEKSYQLVS